MLACRRGVMCQAWWWSRSLLWTGAVHVHHRGMNRRAKARETVGVRDGWRALCLRWALAWGGGAPPQRRPRAAAATAAGGIPLPCWWSLSSLSLCSWLSRRSSLSLFPHTRFGCRCPPIQTAAHSRTSQGSGRCHSRGYCLTCDCAGNKGEKAKGDGAALACILAVPLVGDPARNFLQKDAGRLREHVAGKRCNTVVGNVPMKRTRPGAG